MTTRVPLAFGLVADVVSDETDRLPFVPPPLKEYEHDDRCRCDKCRAAAARNTA
jgi:hypothetical protein